VSVWQTLTQVRRGFNRHTRPKADIELHRASGIEVARSVSRQMRRRLPSRHRGAAADPSPTRRASVARYSVGQFPNSGEEHLENR
jgi:hypothetical protein